MSHIDQDALDKASELLKQAKQVLADRATHGDSPISADDVRGLITALDGLHGGDTMVQSDPDRAPLGEVRELFPRRSA